jgi:hypothetical protein
MGRALQAWERYPWPMAAVIGLIVFLIDGAIQFGVLHHTVRASAAVALTAGVLWFLIWGLLGMWRARRPRE